MSAPSNEIVVAPRKRVAKGPKRPQYLENPELDKFMMMFTALLGEVSALRDRVDTHEALATQGRPLTTEEVEAYKITEERQRSRDSAREAMLNRVFRILLEEREEARDALNTQLLEQVLKEDEAT